MPDINDVVLIYFDENPSVFARIENIEPDIKKNWYHVTILLLTIPMQSVTWILRDEYIAGNTFTMGGRPVRLEVVKKAEFQKEQKSNPSLIDSDDRTDKKNVIPFKKPGKQGN